MGDPALHRSHVEALVVEDIHKSFDDLSVLRGVSMQAHEGDVLSIIGASGSGKSTLLRCINLLEAILILPICLVVSNSGRPSLERWP